MSKVIELEPWLTVSELARHLKCSPRWVEYRIQEGLPSAVIAGRRKFRASEAESWLERRGHMRKDGAA